MKQAFALVVLIVTPFVAFAQGTIAVANGAFSLVQKSPADGGTAIPAVAAGGGMVEFLAAADGAPFKPLGTLGVFAGDVGFAVTYSTLASYLAANPGWNAYSPAIIGPVAGRFNAGTVTVNPLAPGGKIEYVMIGWTGSSARLDDAIASGAYIGESPLFTGIATGNPTTTPPGIPSSMSSSFTGLILAPVSVVPEPSTFALTGLGAVMLIVLRRRR